MRACFHISDRSRMVGVVMSVRSEGEKEFVVVEHFECGECHFLITPPCSCRCRECDSALASVEESSIRFCIMELLYNRTPHFKRFASEMVVHHFSVVSSSFCFITHCRKSVLI